MSENASDFRKALVELVETTEPDPAEHPSADRWIVYQRGELPAEEEARLAGHLVRCRDCFDLVQAADALFGPEGEPEETLASTAVWRLLRPRLGGEPKKPTGVSRRSTFRFRFPYALAAVLFVAVLGLSAWNLAQRNALSALRAPRPNATIVDFTSGDRLVESGERTLTADTGPWTLIFHPGDELPLYRLTIHDVGTGREAFLPVLLQPDRDLALILTLPELPPGRYRLELADGSRESPSHSLETHFLRVVPRGG